MACPRAAISRTSSGQARANRPITKNVACAEWRSSRSSNAGVMLGFGPSSNVSAIEPLDFVRRNVGPNNCDPGFTAPHAVAAAAAAATGTHPSAMASAFIRQYAGNKKRKTSARAAIFACRASPTKPCARVIFGRPRRRLFVIGQSNAAGEITTDSKIGNPADRQEVEYLITDEK